MLIALVKFPLVVNRLAFNTLETYYGIKEDKTKRVRKDEETGHYVEMYTWEYYKDEVISTDDGYVNSDGDKLSKYHVYDRPPKDIVCLKETEEVLDVYELYKHLNDLELTIKKVFPISFEISSDLNILKEKVRILENKG